jgi:hypothetical protein
LPSLGGKARGGLADRDRDGIVARKIRTKDGVGQGGPHASKFS